MKKGFRSSLYTLVVCLCISNKCQNGWTDRVHFFVGPRVMGWFENNINFKNLPLTKFDFWKLWKSTKLFFIKSGKSFVVFLFYNVYKEKMFTIEMEDGREAKRSSSLVLLNFLYHGLINIFLFLRLVSRSRDFSPILLSSSARNTLAKPKWKICDC